MTSQSVMAKKLRHDDYTVGWIAAITIELAAAMAALDETHETLSSPQSDHNTYAFGRIGNHNIVIACLPKGEYGTSSATQVAADMKSTFKSIRFGLMVGIGGGIPNNREDICLGDVVISTPTETSGGVVQYDYGKAEKGKFERTGMLNRPPTVLLTALSALQGIGLNGKNKVAGILAEIQKAGPHLARPEAEDHLYFADYVHVVGNSESCTDCDSTKIVERPPRDSQPRLHCGIIASSNTLVRDSRLRDQLWRQFGAYCVDMEAAGLMNNSSISWLVIRGISDYADSHKNKQWQGYASAVAAAYAKALLLLVHDIDKQMQTAQDALSGSGMLFRTNSSSCAPLTSIYVPLGRIPVVEQPAKLESDEFHHDEPVVEQPATLESDKFHPDEVATDTTKLHSMGQKLPKWSYNNYWMLIGFLLIVLLALAVQVISPTFHSQQAAPTNNTREDFRDAADRYVHPAAVPELNLSIPIFAVMGRHEVGKSSFIDLAGGINVRDSQRPLICKSQDCKYISFPSMFVYLLNYCLRFHHRYVLPNAGHS